MGREPFWPPGVAPPSCVWPDSFTAPTVLKAARRGPAMRSWSGAARYGRSSGSPRKSLPICTAPSNDGTCSATFGRGRRRRNRRVVRLWCKWRRPIGYVGMLNWLRSSMGKLKAVAELFEGRHFDREVIILCVRWYLRFKLSLRDLVEMMAERSLSRAHTTIMRWVQRYAPEFEKRWRRFARAVGPSWRVDETYVKIRGEWRYLYRAVDRAGRTVDFRLSPRRDVAAAKAFFRKAIKSQQRCPRTITLDGYAASHRAVRELKADGSLPANTKLRSSKYLNNLIEQDHRGVKQRIAVMLGFKEFRIPALARRLSSKPLYAKDLGRKVAVRSGGSPLFERRNGERSGLRSHVTAADRDPP